jgi:AraC-like DNA-binding protein
VEYREYAPSGQLASVVQRVWSLEGDAAELGDQLQPVLPDGRPELVIHLGDPFERIYADGSSDCQPAVLFAGQLTQQLVLRPAGRIAVIGVRLRPHGASALWHQPQHEFLGLTIGVDLISRPLCEALGEAAHAAISLADAARQVQDRLATFVKPWHADPRIAHAVDAIQRSRGDLAIDELISRVGMTRRHFERRFKAAVGIAAKRLARIERFQHALGLLEPTGSQQTGAAVAAACGYADQAHFVRECRELCGRPPGAYLLERAQLTELFVS